MWLLKHHIASASLGCAVSKIISDSSNPTHSTCRINFWQSVLRDITRKSSGWNFPGFLRLVKMHRSSIVIQNKLSRGFPRRPYELSFWAPTSSHPCEDSPAPRLVSQAWSAPGLCRIAQSHLHPQYSPEASSVVFHGRPTNYLEWVCLVLLAKNVKLEHSLHDRHPSHIVR